MINADAYFLPALRDSNYRVQSHGKYAACTAGAAAAVGPSDGNTLFKWRSLCTAFARSIEILTHLSWLICGSLGSCQGLDSLIDGLMFAGQARPRRTNDSQ